MGYKPVSKRGQIITFPNKGESRKKPQLFAVSQALSRDEAANKVLDMILERALEYTLADGGTIYLIDKMVQDSLGGARPAHRFVLRFHKSSNQSLTKHLSMVNQLIEVDPQSIAGYVALSGETVRVRDCYSLPENTPFEFNPENDAAMNYMTKSVLAIPIKSEQNLIIGVVQLVNKSKAFRRRDDPGARLNYRDVIAFSENDEGLIESFASHAAIALEKAQLTRDIDELFESFVKASVTAIETRDPSTSGHSDRVASLSVAFAEKVDILSAGPFKDIRFSKEQLRELRYAALLHDFGKIGVRENVLLKAKKLYPYELETILLRLETLRSKQEANVWRQACEEIIKSYQDLEKNRTNLNHKCDDPGRCMGHALWQVDSFNRQIEEIKRGVLVANEPQILDRDFNINELIAWIKKMGQQAGLTIVTEQEVLRLSIPRGTLNSEERREINSHVSHTYNFLKQIAWTQDLARVPDIAHAHHEKLDGTGYPRNLKADQIPVQARMMAISDIYDALTAMDRPYKKSVDPERALEILNIEATEGKLDTQLLKIFIEAEVFKVSEPSRWSKKKVG